MLAIDVIIKAITLLHRESELEENTDHSRELVKTVLDAVSNSAGKLYQGGESEILENLKHLVIDYINSPDNYSKETLLQSLELIIKDNASLLKVIDKAINVELSQPSLKRTIISLRNTLNNYYKEEELKKLISAASYKLSTNTLNNRPIQEFASELATNIEALTMLTKTKDPGIVDEIDMADEDNMTVTLDRVKNNVDGSTKLTSGWKELNVMTQGGFRRGEFCAIYALQHKYKSGFLRSLFMQLPMHNKPVMTDPSKKPLMVFISFEDDADIMLDFMYKYLYYNEHDKLPDLATITTKEVAKYIKDKLTTNGYNIKILRVNPSEWTYKHLFNKILEYEAAGFELHALFLDYLSKLPTTGCISGPAGVDIRDLFNRVRNFSSAKNIFCATPHQLSSEAKQLIRNGVPDVNFVKEVVGKGYTEGSKQIDQVQDLELYVHIARIQRKPYLTVQRGKHRTPGILDDDKMYFTLPFPKGAPIKENLNSESEVALALDADEDFEF